MGVSGIIKIGKIGLRIQLCRPGRGFDFDHSAYFLAGEPLIFELDPGQQDGWRFISDKKKVESLDSSFRSLLIKSAKCERKIERSTLEKHVRKEGAWMLRIDQTLFSC